MASRDRFDVDLSNRPEYVTRKAVAIMGVIIGVVIGIVIVIMAITLARVSTELKARRRTDADIAKIAKRVFPQQVDADKQVLQVLKHCAETPACRKALKAVVSSAHDHAASDNANPTSKPLRASFPGGSSGSGAASPEKGGNTGGSAPSHGKKPTHGGSGGGSGGTPQPNPTPQPTPTPVVGVTAPLVPPTCIGNLIHVNCP